MKKIAILGLFLIYSLFAGAIGFRMTQSLFADSASSTNNSFTAAAVFPTATPSATPTPTSEQTNIANHVVISEIQIATSESTLSDFVELYNPTSSVVNLNNFRLVKRTNGGTTDTDLKSFGSSDNIQPHSYYLWASSTGGYSAQIGADTSTAQNIAADNSVALRNGADDTGIVIDQVAWGNPSGTPLVETTPFTPSPGDNQSIERKANALSDVTSMTSGVDISKGNGYDTDQNNTDFILRPTSQPQNSSSGAETP